MIAIAIVKIRDELQSKLIGLVEVKVSSRDVLYVSITVPNLPTWNWYIEEITEQLHAGVTCNQIVEWCVRAYTRHICSMFIKNS